MQTTTRSLFLVPLVLALLVGSLRGQQTGDSLRLVLTNAQVVDVRSGTIKPGRTIFIAGSRITGLDSARSSLPRARIVDLAGRYVIPGLWDMHVHLDDAEMWAAGPTEPDKEEVLRLLVLLGITGVRDMGGGYEQLTRWRARIAERTLLGPRILAMAGTLVDGSPPVWVGSSVAVTSSDGARAVQSQILRGADFVKVYARLSRDAFFGIAQESRRLGVPFAGHVPARVTALEATNAGQRSIDHLHGVPLGCSGKEPEIRARIAPLLARDPKAEPPEVLWGGTEVWNSFHAAKCDALLRRFAANETWQVPTLRALWGIAHATDSTFVGDSRLDLMPRHARRYWEFIRSALASDSTVPAALRRYVPFAMQLISRMHRAGVGIMAGSDLPSPPYAMPGFALHDELRLLVQAGLTPSEALRAATLQPARFLGLEDSFGSVEPGKIADLIVLRSNPLTEISNTLDIEALVVGGRLITGEERSELLDSIRRHWASQGSPR